TRLQGDWSSDVCSSDLYTLAHNLGNADGNVGAAIQDAHHPEREFGPVLPDLRHRFVVSYIYELPIGRGRHFHGGLGSIADGIIRSEERRVGKECRYWWW